MADVPKLSQSRLKSIFLKLRENYMTLDAAPAFYMDAPIKYKPGQLSDLVCYSFDFTKGLKYLQSKLDDLLMGWNRNSLC